MNRIKTFELVKGIINEWDPVNLIELGAPIDEYNNEISMIASKIKEESNVNDIAEVIYNTLIEMFDKATFENIEKLKTECLSIAEILYKKIKLDKNEIDKKFN